MPRSLAERGSVIAALILVLTVNWLANAIPLGGFQTGQVSALYESYFTPAGFTFAIWGVIYTGLLFYAIYQFLPGREDEPQLRWIGRLFVVNALLNSAWLFAWHYQFLGLSLLLMVGVLTTLLMVYRQLGDWGQTSLWVRVPFTLYLAWICVATLANASALQTALQFNDLVFSHVHWTQLKIALAGAVGATVCALRRDIAFILVISWAAFGIASKQVAIPEVHGAALTVAVLGVTVALITLLRIIRRRLNPAL